MSAGTTHFRALSAVCSLAALMMASGCHRSGPAAAPAPGTAEEVAVGYGEQTRRSLTGSVASATAEDFDDLRVARAEELLEGRFPGVQLVRLPGGGISIRVRGTRSLLGGNEPLFVIDGVPVSSHSGTALQGIHPGDIARIDVLKDAGSTAVYGSRGANGVILITTKRAR